MTITNDRVVLPHQAHLYSLQCLYVSQLCTQCLHVSHLWSQGLHVSKLNLPVINSYSRRNYKHRDKEDVVQEMNFSLHHPMKWENVTRGMSLQEDWGETRPEFVRRQGRDEDRGSPAWAAEIVRDTGAEKKRHLKRISVSWGYNKTIGVDRWNKKMGGKKKQ